MTERSIVQRLKQKISGEEFAEWSWRVKYGVAGLLFVTLVSGGFLKLSGIYVIFPETASVLQLVEIGGTLLLTSSLVILYYQQKNLTSLEHHPEIHLNRVRPDRQGSFSYLVLEMSNFGKGVAKDLELELIPHIDDSEFEFLPTFQRVVRKGLKEGDWVGQSGNYLNPRESNIAFQSSASIREDNREGGDSPWVFELVTERLSEMGERYLQLELVVHYNGISNQEFSTSSTNLILPIKGRTSLELALDRSLSYNAFKNNPGMLDASLRSMEEDSGKPENLFDLPDLPPELGEANEE